MTKKEYPPYIMETLRQRYGLEETDTSMDGEFNLDDPFWVFAHVVAWNLGTPVWADEILSWLRDCGLEVKEKKKE